ncbi:uncharacterized protein LOC128389185 isoform X2 [Panonychus citri]|uniref:uncharacterized protein LOC128389185 isoform X2 n=1 Tax=Panonychus citri TaxID=50023 RepID=UPI002307D1BC|nr:uncharacterized protein LOC128389185 isoform X2 [Panonychus citri]
MLYHLGPHALYRNFNYLNFINNVQEIVNSKLKAAFGLRNRVTKWAPILVFRCTNPLTIWLQANLEAIKRSNSNPLDWPVVQLLTEKLTFNPPNETEIENFWKRKCTNSPLEQVYICINKESFTIDNEKTVYLVDSSPSKTILIALFMLINKHKNRIVNYQLPENVVKFPQAETTQTIIRMLAQHRVMYTWSPELISRSIPMDVDRTITLNNKINLKKDIRCHMAETIEEATLKTRKPSIFTLFFPEKMPKSYNSLHGVSLKKILNLCTDITMHAEIIGQAKGKRGRSYLHYLRECKSTRDHWSEEWDLTKINDKNVKEKIQKLEKISEILINKSANVN